MKKALLFLLVIAGVVACNKYRTAKNELIEMKTISYIDRADGTQKTENVPSEGMLKWLYSTTTGKAALHILFKRKVISALGGWYMDSSLSKKRIQNFINEHNINLDECLVSDANAFPTFNQFFYRQLKPGARPIGEHLVSPADGKILVFQTLDDISEFFIKGSEFTIPTFLQDDELAKKYKNGSMAIIRLAPADYHRFHFPASGIVTESKAIKGHYFSVSPLALQGSLKIFCENYREYCIQQTKEYGDILISDVGATMVGSIIQTYRPSSEIEKGDEKGYFAFGGSTLVLLFEQGKIQFDEDLISNTRKGLETYIQMGENIAK